MTFNVLPKNKDYVTKCLTDECNDCTGFYFAPLLEHHLVCKCQCHHHHNNQTEQQAITIVGSPAMANTKSIDNNNPLNTPQSIEIPATSEGPNLLSSSSSAVVREENNNINKNNNKSVSGLQPVVAQQGIVVAIKQQREQQNNNNNLFKCFHCDQYFANDIERVTHIGYEHPGRLYYPTPKDFDDRLEI